jgi:hypothetical protein
MMAQFYTPPGYSGSALLTASTGLEIESMGLWRFNQAGYVDNATFGLSLGSSNPSDVGDLVLRAQNWTIAVIGNQLTEYADPETGTTYPAAACRIAVTGSWSVTRQVNSNSFNSIGVQYQGLTETDQGSRTMDPALLNYVSDPITLIIQGAAVEGGAENTFAARIFRCRITESTRTDNSNRQYQSNTTVRPVWAYEYSKSWQIAP